MADEPTTSGADRGESGRGDDAHGCHECGHDTGTRSGREPVPDETPSTDGCGPRTDGSAPTAGEGDAKTERSTQEPDEREELRLSVPDMDCASCAGKVRSSVSGLDGVRAVDPRPTTGTLVVDYDPSRTAPEAIAERVERAGYSTTAGEVETLAVPEMDCPSCAGKVERSLADDAGVLDVDTQPASGRVTVTYDPDATSLGAVVAAIEGAGYRVAEADEGVPSPHDVWRSRRAAKTGVGAVLLIVGLVLEFLVPGELALATLLGREFTVAWVSYLGASLVAGGAILRNGLYSARARSLDIDLLMAGGIVGALLVNLPFEAATLAVLYSVAELLERFSMDRARTSLRELLELSPDTATVRRDGEEHVVPAEAVRVGETVVVRPGEKVPVDGVVTEGVSTVDESPITGESVPVDKAPGGEVFAGSLNGAGYLEVEATATAADSTLQTVIELVEDAERNRTRHERFVDRFARYYTPTIVVGAILTALLSPMVFGITPRQAFVRGLTLLVVACPCAFVISTPVSVVSGITSAARNGVLVKGGDRLEAMGGVEAIALDKTGTLTTGELAVTDVVPLDGRTAVDLLGCARAVERRSEHPIAAAVVSHAEERGVPDREVSDFEAIPGKGARADLDGETHYVGKPGLFRDLGFDLGHAHVATDGGATGGATRDGATDGGTAHAEATPCEHGEYVDLAGEVIPRLQAEGKSIVLVGTEDGIEGILAIADAIRPEARATVSRLRDLGVSHVVMLTGDNERTARAIAAEAGISEVRADLLPAEKVEAIEALRERWNGVAMVGDGVNDAPALAAADVGIAMGAAGTDTAIETADVALLGDDLAKLPYLYRLARRAGRVIRQNIVSSLLVKAVLAVGAPLGLVSVITAIVVGDMGMSLGVTANAMRLAGIRPDE